MAGLDKDLLRSVYPLLDHVLDLSPAERVVWLERLRVERPALAPGLEVLLGHADELEQSGIGAAEDWLGLVDVVAPSLAGLTVGAYTLERPLGRGGMGSVWLAGRSDGRYEGRVAVKLLNLALLDPVGRERFRREGTVLAKLDHPGIARLIDAGVTLGGQPFLVLEYVEGRQIDEYCDDGRLTPEQRIGLVLQVLAAVGHAHANLIVHRDLKTSNILVTSDASVKLLDFGIAKLLQGDAAQRTTLTEAGGLPLTPEFAAPEQVTGGAITTATDVYALGVLLYLLLAGRHPTAPGRATSAEHLRASLEIDPPRLSAAVTDAARGKDEPARVATLRGTTVARLRRLYAGDLDNILAKALQKDPARRYSTVAALGDDLRRFLRHQPVEARTASLAYRTRKFIRRNRAGVLAAGVTLATLLGATAFSVGQMREARRQRDAALEESRRKTAMSDVQSILAGDSRGADGRTLSSVERIELAQRVLERKYRDQPAVVVDVLADLAGRLYDSGDLQANRRILGQAAAIARRANLPEQLALVACLRSASYTYDEQLDSARLDLSEARAALARARGGSPFVEAECLDAEGQLYVARQLPDSGVTVLRRALALTELSVLDASIRLQVLNNLATALRAAGRTREASRYQHQVLFELDSMGYVGTDILPAAMSFWAGGLSELGEFRTLDSVAGGYVRRLEAEWGNGQTGGTIASLYGTNKLRLGDLDSAETWIGRAALDSSDAGIHVVSKMWLPPSLMQLRLDQGRAAAARKILPDLPVGTAVRQMNRALLTARLRRLEGDVPGSRAVLDSALRAAGGGPGPPPHLSLALITAAEWRLADHDARGTDSLARLAIRAAALDSLALIRSGYVGRGELLRARAALAAGHRKAAVEAANRAVTALTSGYGPSNPRTDEARRFRDSLP